MKHFYSLSVDSMVPRLASLYDLIVARWAYTRQSLRKASVPLVLVAVVYLMIVLLALPLAL